MSALNAQPPRRNHGPAGWGARRLGSGLAACALSLALAATATACQNKSGVNAPTSGSKAEQVPAGKKGFGDQGVTDPTPQTVEAKPVATPYSGSKFGGAVGRLFSDLPNGETEGCTATVVKDPAHPGKSNLVWTAGHCVHEGKGGTWRPNITFLPAFNDNGLPVSRIKDAAPEDLLPFGSWKADDVSASSQWISEGSTGESGDGMPFDFAIVHVTGAKGSKSLEETVGSAVPIDFDAPRMKDIGKVAVRGYPDAKPFNGVRMLSCEDRPTRLTMKAGQPTLYRIGCTMTKGASGGGWFMEGSDGNPVLVSNSCYGHFKGARWLAGPHLGPEAKALFNTMSKKHADA